MQEASLTGARTITQEDRESELQHFSGLFRPAPRTCGAKGVNLSSQQEDAMTHITPSVPLIIHFPGLPRFKLPHLGIGDAINSLSITISKAVRLAYVEPFTARRPQAARFIDADLEGRDPNW
jgi:hypothetical protein